MAACSGGNGATLTPGPVPTPTPKPTINITGLPAGPLNPNAAYQITATETIGGATVTPGTLTFTLDNAAVGTITGSMLLAGIANAKGMLTVTDTSHNLTTTVAVAVGSLHPSTSGDSFSLVGSIVQTITRPQPAPVATAPVFSYNTNVAIATTVTTGASFGSLTGLTDLKSVEQDTTQSPAITTTTTTDAFQTIVPSGTLLDVITPGFSATDSNGNAFKTVFGTGNGILDVLPEMSGGTFANTAALTYSETDADGTTLARTDSADGTYTEADTFADRTSQAIAVKSDLSGTLGTVRGSVFSIAVSAPTVATASAPSVINFTLSRPGPSPTSAPIVVTAAVPDWYPSTTLAKDTAVMTTAQTIPSACNVPATVGATATAIAETFLRLDPVLGTYEARTTTSYLAPFVGLACVQINDKLDDYYDYSRQVAGLSGVVAVSSQPLQTTVTAETIALKTASIAGAPSIAAVQRTFAVAKASFARVIERANTERRRHVYDTLSHAQSLKQVNR